MCFGVFFDGKVLWWERDSPQREEQRHRFQSSLFFWSSSELDWETEDLTMQRDFSNPKTQMTTVYMVVVFSGNGKRLHIKHLLSCVIIVLYCRQTIKHMKMNNSIDLNIKVSQSNPIQIKCFDTRKYLYKMCRTCCVPKFSTYSTYASRI